MPLVYQYDESHFLIGCIHAQDSCTVIHVRRKRQKGNPMTPQVPRRQRLRQTNVITEAGL